MDNNAVYRVAGYVKLAKWWDRSRDKAIEYHNNYYREKFQNDPHMDLRGVYIDITGQKQIRRRPEMVRLINDCVYGQINCIATQTRAYLAANNEEFFYLIHMLLTLPHPIQIVTEDDNYHIDTIRDVGNQAEALKKMAADYVAINPKAFEDWRKEILRTEDKNSR